MAGRSRGSNKKGWWSFEKSREYVRSLGLIGQRAWKQAVSNDVIPCHIRSNPDTAYGEWVDWWDWLGTEKPPEYVSFVEGKKWARENAKEIGAYNFSQWVDAHKNGLIPVSIPSNPHTFVMWAGDWGGWRDFVGSWTFDEARDWAWDSNVFLGDWNAAYERGEIPLEIPLRPNLMYRKDWGGGWENFLREYPAGMLKVDEGCIYPTGLLKVDDGYWGFEEANEWASSSNIVSVNGWKVEYASGVVPRGIPRFPKDEYVEWDGWDDFFGLGQDVPFDEAREWTREWAKDSGAKTGKDWRQAWDNREVPKWIPRYPRKEYKGDWGGWFDFLVGYWSFDEAREWVRDSDVFAVTLNDWSEAYDAGLVPINIPRNPSAYFKNGNGGNGGWAGWLDWVGSRSFEEAREWAREWASKWPLGYAHMSDWTEAYDRGEIPKDILRAPWTKRGASGSVYDGWVDWNDWLGVDKARKPSKLFPDDGYATFYETRRWAKKSNIRRGSDWVSEHIAGRVPECFPRYPMNVIEYGSKWSGWPDLLIPKSMPFEKARKYARKWATGRERDRILSEWNNAWIAGEIPKAIPRLPKSYSEWEGADDFFGVSRVKKKRKKKPGRSFSPFNEVREWARASGMMLAKDWMCRWREVGLPEGFPRNPRMVYDEWDGWDDFFGKKQLPFEEAREYVRTLGLTTRNAWKKAYESGIVPEGIPKNPKTYVEWVSWDDWLFSGWAAPFESARKWAIASSARTPDEWGRLELPENVPRDPESAYRWIWGSWEDWLGVKKSKWSIIDSAFDLFVNKGWPYESAGKIQVCEMMQGQWGRYGYYEPSLLSLPGHGRELCQATDNGFRFNFDECLGVERNKVGRLREILALLSPRIGGTMKVFGGDVDKLLLYMPEKLPEFNSVHLDYNGPLTFSHVLALEAALRNNPDAVVAITVQSHDRFGRALDYSPGCFPFVSMSPELLFYQPYPGKKSSRWPQGCPMETYCFVGG